MSHKPKLLLNGAFIGQRVTGQQRYATEILKQLVEDPDVEARILSPGKWWSKSPLRVWLWSQFIPFLRRRHEYLLTLTSRGPIFARKQIVVVHDLFVINHPEWYSKKYAITHRLVLKCQLKLASAILVVSEPVGEQVRQVVGDRKPIYTATNAPADIFLNHRSKVQVETTLAKYGLNFGKYVLAVATRDPRKNLSRLLQAHAALSDELEETYPLVMVGGEEKSFGETDYELHRSAKRLGYLTDGDLADLYTGAGTVAFPSLDEGFGLPAVEALAAGATLVTSDMPVQHWVCGPHAIYVDPWDVDAIRYGLKRAIDLQDMISEDVLLQRRIYIADRYSWAKSKGEVLRLLLVLTSSGKNRT